MNDQDRIALAASALRTKAESTNNSDCRTRLIHYAEALEWVLGSGGPNAWGASAIEAVVREAEREPVTA